MRKMGIYEKCDAIRSLYLNRVASITVYDKWTDKFKLSEIKDIPEIVKGWEKEHGSFKIEPNLLTMEDTKKLGFGKWDKSDLRLIPLWLFPFLSDELEVYSINGKKVTNLSDIDRDNRFGCLAYGVKPYC
jgi:hypothetical protein